MAVCCFHQLNHCGRTKFTLFRPGRQYLCLPWAPTPANFVVALKMNRSSFEVGQTTARPERLLKSHGGIDCVGGQDLRCVRQIPWGQRKLASISPFFGLPEYLKKNLFKLALPKFPTNFQRISNPFRTSFKIISNQSTSPLRLLKNFNPS